MDKLGGDTGKISSKLKAATDEMCAKYGEGSFQHAVSVATPFETVDALVTLCPWVAWRSGIIRTAAISQSARGKRRVVWFYGSCAPNANQLQALRGLAELFGIDIDYASVK